ncbi:MAG: hypothetical protein ACRD3Q_15170 [Terriglobales bacterium]
MGSRRICLGLGLSGRRLALINPLLQLLNLLVAGLNLIAELLDLFCCASIASFSSLSCVETDGTAAFFLGLFAAPVVCAYAAYMPPASAIANANVKTRFIFNLLGTEKLDNSHSVLHTQ